MRGMQFLDSRAKHIATPGERRAIPLCGIAGGVAYFIEISPDDRICRKCASKWRAMEEDESDEENEPSFRFFYYSTSRLRDIRFFLSKSGIIYPCGA